jgi:hypothetical protein
MRPIGLVMIGIAIAMFGAARPRNGKIVPWLSRIEYVYTITMIILLFWGIALALYG